MLLVFCMRVGAGRFDLNARLIGSKAKQAAQQLCKELAAPLEQAAGHGSSSSSSAGGGSGSGITGSSGSTTEKLLAEACVTTADSELQHMHLQTAAVNLAGSKSDDFISAKQCMEVLQQLQHVCRKLCIAL
jgi:hypothetical protein